MIGDRLCRNRKEDAPGFSVFFSCLMIAGNYIKIWGQTPVWQSGMAAIGRAVSLPGCIAAMPVGAALGGEASYEGWAPGASDEEPAMAGCGRPDNRLTYSYFHEAIIFTEGGDLAAIRWLG